MLAAGLVWLLGNLAFWLGTLHGGQSELEMAAGRPHYSTDSGDIFIKIINF